MESLLGKLLISSQKRSFRVISLASHIPSCEEHTGFELAKLVLDEQNNNTKTFVLLGVVECQK